MMKDLEEEIDTETARLDTAEGASIEEPEDASIESDHDERVRHRAYLLWESDGEPDGRDQDYWFQAEREIAGEEDELKPPERRLTP